MTTYSKYTVAMTFRVCFTFGLLTVAYNWTFPTILIVLLAVFNDGAMIALSKDRTSPSPTPNSWRLRDIFVVGARTVTCVMQGVVRGVWRGCGGCRGCQGLVWRVSWRLPWCKPHP
jgi:hypothetical protein